MIVIAYARLDFNLDRDDFRTKQETLGDSNADGYARLFVDQRQMSEFRLGFSTLQLTSATPLLIKTALLLLSVFKWRAIISHLVQSHYRAQRELAWTAPNRSRGPRHTRHASTRRHLFAGVAIFLMLGVCVSVYTAGAIATSLAHCQAHPHCVVISYHWTFPEETCPCLAYINRVEAPRSYDDWQQPPDVTAELAELAHMGELNVVEVVNLALPVLPDQLRHCKKLQQLILIHTHTAALPSWAQELTEMQYIHIEGDFSRNLRLIPSAMFEHMPHLRYLYLGIIPMLEELPSLAGLRQLRVLALVAPHALTRLPSFDDLVALETLTLVEPLRLTRLPSLQSATRLAHFSLSFRSEMCCNGFLTPGQCQFDAQLCVPRGSNASAVPCLADTVAHEDWAALQRAAGATAPLCTTPWPASLSSLWPTRATSDGACGGVLFRQCRVGSSVGMCFNSRLQVVHCELSSEYMEMRRLQIERDVGPPCDPLVEAWLGCGKR
ncbi:hypothetical protein PINS_up011962 [Pythium insidiosum]|nr:hypothetical protein PINS_up011962 [Pythium insidiosum]